MAKMYTSTSATSFDELESSEQSRMQSRQMMSLLEAFETLATNITSNDGFSDAEKQEKLRKLTAQLSNRLDKVSKDTELTQELEVEDTTDVVEVAEAVTPMQTSVPFKEWVDARLNEFSNGISKMLSVKESVQDDETPSPIEVDDTDASTKSHVMKQIETIDYESNDSGFKMYKDIHTGNYRWLGWATNKFIDRDGEILLDEAHVEFMEYLDENPDQAPELWTWHVSDTARKSKADFWAYTNGFFLYSGELTEEEAKQFENESETVKSFGNIGMSHGFYVLERHPDNPKHIKRYRTFEVSDLPVDNAANEYTEFATVSLEKSTKSVYSTKEFSPKQRAYLTQRFGADITQKIEDTTKLKHDALVNAGVASKSLSVDVESTNIKEDIIVLEEDKDVVSEATENKDDGVVVVETASTITPIVETVEVAKTQPVELDEKAIVERVKQGVIHAINVPGLMEVIELLQTKSAKVDELVESLEKAMARIDALEKSDDEKIASAIGTPSPINWGAFSATTSEATVISEEKQAEYIESNKSANAPRGWLSGWKVD